MPKYLGRRALGQVGMMRCLMDWLLTHGFVQVVADAGSPFSVDVATSELGMTPPLQLRRYRTAATYHMQRARDIGCIGSSGGR
jgi:hypothetical protein